MSPSDHLGVAWPDLTAAIAKDGTWQRWTVQEPALGAVAGLDVVRARCHSRIARDQADDLFGALLRLANHDGGDDQQAALVVAHLLGVGARSLSTRLARAGVADADAVVSAPLWLTIRTAPLGSWNGRYAANILWVVRKTVEAELLHYAPRSTDAFFHVDPGVRLEDELEEDEPLVLGRRRPRVVESVEEPSVHRSEAELVVLLEWALDQGLITAEAHDVLLSYVLFSEDRPRRAGRFAWADDEVAQAHATSTRSARRTRRLALDALIAHADDFLAVA